MAIGYEVKLKNGNKVVVDKETYLSLSEILFLSERPEFIMVNDGTIISTSMIAIIEKEDDGSLE